MTEGYFIDEFLYVEKEKVKRSILNITFGLVIGCIFLNFEGENLVLFSKMLGFVFAACIIIICAYSLTVGENSRIKNISIGFSVLAILFLIKVILVLHSMKNSLSINSEIANTGNLITLYIYNVLMYSFINYKRLDKNYLGVKYKVLMVAAVLSIIALYILKINPLIIFILAYISNIILLVVNFTYAPKINISKNGSWNFIPLYLYLLIVTMIILPVVMMINIPKINLIIEIIIFIINMTFFSILINRITNTTYSEVFADIKNANYKLIELNDIHTQKNSDLEKSKNDLEKREKLYRLFIRKLPIPIFIVNKENGVITYCNNRTLELTNAKSDLVGDEVDTVLIVNNDKVLENVDGEIIRIGKIKSDEGYKDVEVLMFAPAVLKNEIVFVLKDITIRKEIKDIKKTLEEKSVREKVRKDFLSNISHDLKTPINVIYSSSQLQNVFLENENYEGIERYNIISNENCLSLTKLANNVIDISKISCEHLKTNLRVQNIVEFTEAKVMSLIEFAKSKGIEMVFDTEEEELFIKFDDNLMERVLINILSNAMKFTPENGVILVRVRNDKRKVYIDIQDSGIGMSKEFVKKAFDKYSISNRSKGKEKGSGIGLFVVYNLVKVQEGNVTLESEVGKGTKFILEFSKENYTDEGYRWEI